MKNDMESWTKLANDLANAGHCVHGRPILAGDVPHIVWLMGDLILGIKKDARREAIEAAAKCAAKWGDSAEVRLCAGEMTAQELRTVKAVAAATERAIRALMTPGDGT